MTDKTQLIPTTAELMRLRAVAAGLERPDVIVRGGLVLSPGTEEWLERDILIAGRHIATLTPWGHVTGAEHELDEHRLWTSFTSWTLGALWRPRFLFFPPGRSAGR